MNIIMSTAPFLLRPVREAFRHAADAGFTDVEVMVTRDEDTQDAASLFAAASGFGLKVQAIHAPSLLLTRGIWGTDPIGKVSRAIEMSGQLGAPVVIAHQPFRWQRRYEDWLLQEMPAIAHDAGVKVAVENMFTPRVRSLKGPRLHSKALGGYSEVTLDTSHAAVAGSDIVEAALASGDRLSHVHLSNNGGKGWDSHLPVDEGVLPLGDLLEHLQRSGFGGAVSLELDLRRWMEDPRGMNEVLTRNREFCETPALLAAQ